MRHKEKQITVDMTSVKEEIKFIEFLDTTVIKVPFDFSQFLSLSPTSEKVLNISIIKIFPEF